MKKIWIKQTNYNTGESFCYETDFKTLKEAEIWIKASEYIAYLDNIVSEAFEKEEN